MRIFDLLRLDLTDAEIQALRDGKARVIVESKKVPLMKIEALYTGFAHIGMNRPKKGLSPPLDNDGGALQCSPEAIERAGTVEPGDLP